MVNSTDRKYIMFLFSIIIAIKQKAVGVLNYEM